ncbi:MAG TPA: hypothetical protein PLQ36_04420, partial [Candidatus Gracilibacteria bacterium]|nr:hypothetical protein [Candidatus Gracilibacteria bacterium]
MSQPNLGQKMQFYRNFAANLDLSDLEVLLTIDDLYETIPEEIEFFRQLYSYFDPNLANSKTTFVRIANRHESISTLKKRLNGYLNTRFNCLENGKTYEDNMKIFKQYAEEA